MERRWFGKKRSKSKYEPPRWRRRVKEVRSRELRFSTSEHLAKPQSVLFNNAFLGKGIVHTYSAMAAVHNDAGFQSPYQAWNEQKVKEDFWEEVCQQVALDQPSRIGAFFLFESSDAASNVQKR